MTPLFRRIAVDILQLAQPDFRRLFVGQGVSFVGHQLTAVAVPVQMYAVTRSSFWVGLTGSWVGGGVARVVVTLVLAAAAPALLRYDTGATERQP